VQYLNCGGGEGRWSLFLVRRASILDVSRSSCLRSLRKACDGTKCGKRRSRNQTVRKPGKARFRNGLGVFGGQNARRAVNGEIPICWK
jgi:hypothetical protein